MKDDTISRQAAIEAVHKSYDMILDFKTDGKTISSSIEDILSNLPSAQPGRKRGQWLDGYKRQTCSLCKGKGVRSWNYCPYCGANMREVDDERPD